MAIDSPPPPVTEIERERVVVIRNAEQIFDDSTKQLIADVERFAPPLPELGVQPIVQVITEGASYAGTC